MKNLIIITLFLSISCNLFCQESQSEYSELIDSIKCMVTSEMEKNNIPSISIALIMDDKILWSDGFGYSDPENTIKANSNTVYRFGSVSKMFTDLVVMQQVERGILDLDEPVSKYLNNFHPINPFKNRITLRNLMSHRSGLVREPPIGHYFDNSNPGLEETVERHARDDLHQTAEHVR